jgi:hypothetical protein
MERLQQAWRAAEPAHAIPVTMPTSMFSTYVILSSLTHTTIDVDWDTRPSHIHLRIYTYHCHITIVMNSCRYRSQQIERLVSQQSSLLKKLVHAHSNAWKRYLMWRYLICLCSSQQHKSHCHCYVPAIHLIYDVALYIVCEMNRLILRVGGLLMWGLDPRNLFRLLYRHTITAIILFFAYSFGRVTLIICRVHMIVADCV